MDERRLAILAALQVALRDRRAVIWRIELAGREQDRAFEAALAQLGGGARRGDAAADEEDVVRRFGHVSTLCVAPRRVLPRRPATTRRSRHRRRRSSVGSITGRARVVSAPAAMPLPGHATTSSHTPQHLRGACRHRRRRPVRRALRRRRQRDLKRCIDREHQRVRHDLGVVPAGLRRSLPARRDGRLARSSRRAGAQLAGAVRSGRRPDDAQHALRRLQPLQAPAHLARLRHLGLRRPQRGPSASSPRSRVRARPRRRRRTSRARSRSRATAAATASTSRGRASSPSASRGRCRMRPTCPRRTSPTTAAT